MPSKAMKIGQMYLPAIIPIIIVGAFLLLYHALAAVFLIAVLFFSSYCIGSYFPIYGKHMEKTLIRTAIGLGIIGIVIYFILLLQIGNIALYFFLLAVPLCLRYKMLYRKIKKVGRNNLFVKRHYAFFVLLLLIFIIYSIYGSTPIYQFDDLTKHVPITLYAARYGKWNTDIIESVVYGECMLMQYTYSAMFASFGAYKALALFNVVLSFFTCFSLIFILRDIYKKSNALLLVLVYFSVPLFFNLWTSFYLEVLPLYFLFNAVLSFSSLAANKAWKNSIPAAFLCGCSLFTKLTTCYTILAVGIILMILMIVHCRHEHNNFVHWFLKVMLCEITLIFPSITSVLYMWHLTGNPFFPYYNGYFKSPYFPLYNFVDPFNKSPLSLSFKTLYNIVFQTSKNVELHNGGMGIFLLLSVLIPFAVLIVKKKGIVVWGITPFFIFPISCLFTYNLRYFDSIFLIFLLAIIASVSVFLNKLKHKSYLVTVCILGIVLTVPNLLYLCKYEPIKDVTAPNTAITANANNSILKGIPTGKKVFAVNDPLEGEYDGYYSAYSWHNSYIKSKIENGQLNLKTYVSCFDYVLVNKNNKIDDAGLDAMIRSADQNGSILRTYSEKGNCVLYQVVAPMNLEVEQNIIQKAAFSTPKISQTTKPVVFLFQQKYDYYVISQDISNPSDNKVEICFQINWFNKNNQPTSVYRKTYWQPKGRKISTSESIRRPADAAYGLLYLASSSGKEIQVHGYELCGYNNEKKQITKSSEDYLENEIKQYYSGALLR